MSFRSGLKAFTLICTILCGVFVAQAAPKETVVIDLSNETASLDPHLQWNQNSYGVYRNIFDNLLTRDNNGVIIPAVAKDWKQISDTEMLFTIRDDVSPTHQVACWVKK